MASERTVLLTQLDRMGEKRGKIEREKKEEKKKRILEREYTFSLDFLAISPSNPGEKRDNVDPHCKSYTWVPVLWSFDNSGR